MKIALYLKSEITEEDVEIIKTALNNFKMDKIVVVPSMKKCSSEDDFSHLVYQIFFKLRENDLVVNTKISTIESKLTPPYHIIVPIKYLYYVLKRKLKKFQIGQMEE